MPLMAFRNSQRKIQASYGIACDRNDRRRTGLSGTVRVFTHTSPALPKL